MRRSDLTPTVLTEFKRLQVWAGGKVQSAIARQLLPRVCSKYRACFEEIASIPCVDCGLRAQCYDHRDYLDPLMVDPVCESCNYKRGFAADTFTNHPEYWAAFQEM
jgi:hypothetical protein